jgi:multiple sugar transport system substrate-binding protein
MKSLQEGKGKLLLLIALMMVTMVLGACAAAPATEATDAPEAEETDAPEVEETDAPEAEETDAPDEATEVATEAAGDGDIVLPSVLTMPEEIAGGREVEITVSEMPAESQPELRENWLAQAARFQEMYPNVTVTGDTYTYGLDTFPPLVAAGQVPTLFEAYLTDPDKMIEQGIAADLTTYYEASGLDQVINPNILALVSDDDGNIHGIPRFAYAMGLAYNIELLEAAGYDAPPATWEEALEMAEALTDRDAGVAGLSFITDGSGATGWHLTTIAYTYGLEQSDIVAASDDGYTANFNNDAMLEALNLVHDLRWTADALPRENLGWPTNGEALATEHAAMVVMAGQQFIWIRETYPDAPIEKFGFAPLPSGPNGESASLIGGNVAMVSAAATDDQKEAAFYYRAWTQLDPAEQAITFEKSASNPAVVIGAPNLPLYVGEYQEALKALENKYANVPTENYADFMAAVESGAIRVVPEPTIAGQEYYGIIGTLVSQIVTEEDLDIAAALQEALENYQNNILDLLAN